MVRQFEPGRAVEVISPQYGSAYRIGGRLVLTAAHLLAEVGSACRVRAKQSFGEAEARVVWKAPHSDLALIELDERIAPCAAIVFGSLPKARAGETLEFQMYGYPRWGRTQREQGTAAGGRQVEGIIYLADTSPDGLLVLEAERLPPEALSESGSEWEGSSGAAIICDGLVIAVQSQHQNPKRPASLEASPLWIAYDDEQWCSLLRQHGISPEHEIATIARKSEAKQELKFHLAHRLLRARNWQERPEFNKLCDWWRTQGSGVCALVGIGGSGKTAIVEHFLRKIPGATEEELGLTKDITLPVPQGIIVFSFYETKNTDEFFNEVLNWLIREFSIPDMRLTTSKGHKNQATAQLVINSLEHIDCRILIVLDGLEKIQYDASRGIPLGRIEDDGLRQFLLRISSGLMRKVALIVTTRLRLFDLEYERECGYSLLFTSYRIDKIPEDACIALLREWKVRGDDPTLLNIAHEYGYHALTVDLVGNYLFHFCKGDPHLSFSIMTTEELQQPSDDPYNYQERYLREQTARLNHIIEQYQRALNKSHPAAFLIMQRLCVFPFGVNSNFLERIFLGSQKKDFCDSRLRDLTFKKLRSELNLLDFMGLVQCNKQTEDRDKTVSSVTMTYTVHPALKDSFYKTLGKDVARNCHRAVKTEMMTMQMITMLGGNSDTRWLPPATLDCLEEIIYHTVQVNEIKNAWTIYKQRMGGIATIGWTLGNFERGERICRMLIHNLPPDNQQLFEKFPEKILTNFINDWAYYLMESGKHNEALSLFKQSIRIRRLEKDWRNAVVGYRNLAEGYLLSGHLKRAIRVLNIAIRLAQRIEGGATAGIHRPFYEIPYSWYEECKLSRVRAYMEAQLGNVTKNIRHRVGQSCSAGGWSIKLAIDDNLIDLKNVRASMLSTRQGFYSNAIDYADMTISGAEFKHIICCHSIQFAHIAVDLGAFATAQNLLKYSRNWALARGANELLCWCALVTSRMAIAQQLKPMSINSIWKRTEIDEFRGVNPIWKGEEIDELVINGFKTNKLPPLPFDRFPHWLKLNFMYFEGQLEELTLLNLDRASVEIEKGLHLARSYSFGIYYIDLLLVRARLHLLQGNPDLALSDIKIALEGGQQPPTDTGYPILMGATNPECGYVWGFLEGQHLRAEATLLKAANKLGKSDFTPHETKQQLPNDVRELIAEANKDLQECLKTRQSIEDSKEQETREVLDSLKNGILTRYPIKSIEFNDINDI